MVAFLGLNYLSMILPENRYPLFRIMLGVEAYAQWRGGRWRSTLEISVVPALSRDPYAAALVVTEGI
jgi:hypothetical protein